MNSIDRPTIHYTEISDLPPGTPLAQEVQTYKRELPRLLAEGHEGKAVLIKGDELLGLFETEQAALREGYQRFIRGPFYVHTINEREPLYRVPWRYMSCHT